jgi:hypothetical protein
LQTASLHAADERYLSGRITARDRINPLKSNYKRQRGQRTSRIVHCTIARLN